MSNRLPFLFVFAAIVAASVTAQLGVGVTISDALQTSLFQATQGAYQTSVVQNFGVAGVTGPLDTMPQCVMSYPGLSLAYFNAGPVAVTANANTNTITLTYPSVSFAINTFSFSAVCTQSTPVGTFQSSTQGSVGGSFAVGQMVITTSVSIVNGVAVIGSPSLQTAIGMQLSYSSQGFPYDPFLSHHFQTTVQNAVNYVLTLNLVGSPFGWQLAAPNQFLSNIGGTCQTAQPFQGTLVVYTWEAPGVCFNSVLPYSPQQPSTSFVVMTNIGPVPSWMKLTQPWTVLSQSNNQPACLAMVAGLAQHMNIASCNLVNGAAEGLGIYDVASINVVDVSSPGASSSAAKQLIGGQEIVSANASTVSRLRALRDNQRIALNLPRAKSELFVKAQASSGRKGGALTLTKSFFSSSFAKKAIPAVEQHMQNHHFPKKTHPLPLGGELIIQDGLWLGAFHIGDATMTPQGGSMGWFHHLMDDITVDGKVLFEARWQKKVSFFGHHWTITFCDCKADASIEGGPGQQIKMSSNLNIQDNLAGIGISDTLYVGPFKVHAHLGCSGVVWTFIDLIMSLMSDDMDSIIPEVINLAIKEINLQNLMNSLISDFLTATLNRIMGSEEEPQPLPGGVPVPMPVVNKTANSRLGGGGWACDYDFWPGTDYMTLYTPASETDPTCMKGQLPAPFDPMPHPAMDAHLVVRANPTPAWMPSGGYSSLGCISQSYAQPSGLNGKMVSNAGASCVGQGGGHVWAASPLEIDPA